MTASKIVGWAFAILVSGVALFGLARGSAAWVPAPNASSAAVRLSWSARSQRIEACRTLTAKELAEREEHMRQRVECEGRFATYGLTVDVDGRLLHESIVRGGGLRHDRPLHVLRELTVPPGTHRLGVRFVIRDTVKIDSTGTLGLPSQGADTGLFAGRAQREVTERERRERAAIPATLVLDTTLTFDRGQVVVITYDPAITALRLLSEPPVR